MDAKQTVATAAPDQILAQINAVNDVVRRLSNVRENQSRAYQGLERMQKYMEWEAAMENFVATLPQGDERVAKFHAEKHSKDAIKDKIKQYTLDAGIQLRSLIGVSNDLATAAKELLNLSQPLVAEVVKQEMARQTGSGNLSQDSTKADTYQAQTMEAKAEAAANITGENPATPKFNPAPTL